MTLMASRIRAEAFIKVQAKIYCNGCGHEQGAYKGDFTTHLERKGCTEQRGKGWRFDNGHDSMLRLLEPARSPCEARYVDRTEERKKC